MGGGGAALSMRSARCCCAPPLDSVISPESPPCDRPPDNRTGKQRLFGFAAAEPGCSLLGVCLIGVAVCRGIRGGGGGRADPASDGRGREQMAALLPRYRYRNCSAGSATRPAGALLSLAGSGRAAIDLRAPPSLPVCWAAGVCLSALSYGGRGAHRSTGPNIKGATAAARCFAALRITSYS